jgi:hypothetical protein
LMISRCLRRWVSTVLKEKTPRNMSKNSSCMFAKSNRTHLHVDMFCPGFLCRRQLGSKSSKSPRRQLYARGKLLGKSFGDQNIGLSTPEISLGPYAPRLHKSITLHRFPRWVPW